GARVRAGRELDADATVLDESAAVVRGEGWRARAAGQGDQQEGPHGTDCLGRRFGRGATFRTGAGCSVAVGSAGSASAGVTGADPTMPHVATPPAGEVTVKVLGSGVGAVSVQRPSVTGAVPRLATWTLDTWPPAEQTPLIVTGQAVV